LKHGFPGGRDGEIRILLRRKSATTVTLTLSDNGVGLPDQLDWTTSRSLGLRLVRALAEQLRANLEIRSQGGTEVRVVFTAARKGNATGTGLSAGGSR
jgi:two-component sensor histidine kinase